MRICMLLYGEYPSEPRSRRAAEALVEAGHDVTVLALQGLGERERLTVRGVRVVRVPLDSDAPTGNPFMRKLRTLVRVRRLHDRWEQLAEETSFDVVHAHNLDTLALAHTLAAKRGALLVYDAHELWVEYVGDRGSGTIERLAALPARWYWARIERRLLPKVDVAITVNELIAREMATRYGCAAPEVVLNVTALPADDVEPLPVEMPGLRLIYQGALTEGRGLPELLEAVALVSGVNLTVMGPGPLASQLKERAEQSDLSGRVAVVDPVEPSRVVPVARSAEVGIIPFLPTTLNNYYASPNKLFEYMHAGLAIVATDLPFVRATLEKSGAGLTVPPGDVQALAGVLRTLSADTELLQRLRACSAQAASRYDWEIEKQKLLGIYERLAARSTS